MSEPKNTESINHEVLTAAEFLRKQGFVELERGFFQAGPFVVEVDPDSDKPVVQSLFVSQFSEKHEPASSFVKVELTQAYGEDRLIFTQNNGSTHEIGIVSSGSGQDSRHQLDLPNTITPEQLTNVGFQPQSQENRVFHFRFKSEADRPTNEWMIVLDKDGKPSFIGKSWQRSLRSRGKSEVVELTYLPDPFASTSSSDSTLRPSLVLQSDFLRYAVQDFGGYKFLNLDATRNLPIPDQQPPLMNEPGSGFMIGGDNTDETIRGLTTLTELSIEEIERRARPNAYSQSGFINTDERLLEVLETDNQFVHAQGKTHQQFAEPLMAARYAAYLASEQMNPVVYRYKDRKYVLTFTSYMGSQQSIFNDKLGSSSHITVLDPLTGHQVDFSVLLPDYIARYGFYEGDVPNRVEPQTIVDVFSPSPDDPVLAAARDERVTFEDPDCFRRLSRLEPEYLREILPNLDLRLTDWRRVNGFEHLLQRFPDLNQAILNQTSIALTPWTLALRSELNTFEMLVSYSELSSNIHRILLASVERIVVGGSGDEAISPVDYFWSKREFFVETGLDLKVDFQGLTTADFEKLALSITFRDSEGTDPEKVMEQCYNAIQSAIELPTLKVEHSQFQDVKSEARQRIQQLMTSDNNVLWDTQQRSSSKPTGRHEIRFHNTSVIAWNDQTEEISCKDILLPSEEPGVLIPITKRFALWLTDQLKPQVVIYSSDK